MTEEFNTSLTYKPEDYPGPVAEKATLAVKFCQDVFLMKSFLDQRKIAYKEEDLEDSPLGLGIRIKREDRKT